MAQYPPKSPAKVPRLVNSRLIDMILRKDG